jgi:hypothetical protein
MYLLRFVINLTLVVGVDILVGILEDKRVLKFFGTYTSNVTVAVKLLLLLDCAIVAKLF